MPLPKGHNGKRKENPTSAGGRGGRGPAPPEAGASADVTINKTVFTGSRQFLKVPASCWLRKLGNQNSTGRMTLNRTQSPH